MFSCELNVRTSFDIACANLELYSIIGIFPSNLGMVLIKSYVVFRVNVIMIPSMFI